MYNDVGKKIKALMETLLTIGIVLSVVGGIVVMTISDDLIVVGLLIVIVGSLASWIACIFAYAFGELVDRTCNIEKLLRLSQIEGGLPLEVNAAPQAKSEKFIFCKMCGTKFDLNQGNACPNCGCVNNIKE